MLPLDKSSGNCCNLNKSEGKKCLMNFVLLQLRLGSFASVSGKEEVVKNPTKLFVIKLMISKLIFMEFNFATTSIVSGAQLMQICTP